MHVRKQIRDALQTALTGLTTTGSRVYPSRVHPFHNDGAELPGLCIYSTSEEVRNDEEDSISHIQIRSANFVVEGYVSAADPDTLDDNLDLIASEVETAILADQFLGGICKGIDLVGTDIDLSGDAEKPLGVVMIIFSIIYLTGEGSPDISL